MGILIKNTKIAIGQFLVMKIVKAILTNEER